RKIPTTSGQNTFARRTRSRTSGRTWTKKRRTSTRRAAEKNNPTQRSLRWFYVDFEPVDPSERDMLTQSYFLEKIFERELHNSRIPRRRDFPEKVAIEIECGVHHDEVVENVERLHSKFHLLHFTHRECSREGKIELPYPRTFNITHAAVAA